MTHDYHGLMAKEQPPVPPAPQAPRESSNVVSLGKAMLRRRVVAAITAALERWPPIATTDATAEMVVLDINIMQIINGIKRAEIMEFSEDTKNGRLLFSAKLISAGEEFFVNAAVERVVPFPDSHVVIRHVWR
jgi:hypothetical protein